MGMLGVHCLLRFTEAHTAQVRAICDVTTSRAGSYPFALTGINLGKLMVDLLLLRDVQPQDITDAEDPGPTLVRCWQTPMVALFCQLPPETEDVFTDVVRALVDLLGAHQLRVEAEFLEMVAEVVPPIGVDLSCGVDRDVVHGYFLVVPVVVRAGPWGRSCQSNCSRTQPTT